MDVVLRAARPIPSLIGLALLAVLVPCGVAVGDSALEEVDRKFADLQRHPTNPSYAAAYANALAGAGQWQEALRWIGRVGNHPSLSNNWRLLLAEKAGQCWLSLGQWDRAAQAFETSLSLLDRDTARLYASVLTEARNHLAALDVWRRWRYFEGQTVVVLADPEALVTEKECDRFVYLADTMCLVTSRALGAHLATKIRYFAYKDADLLQQLMGMGSAFADSARYRIHCYGKTPSAHEITHVVSRHVWTAELTTAAFNEGIAEYFNWNAGEVHERVTAVADETSLRRILVAKTSRELSLVPDGYGLGASFLGHLLETYRLPVVRQFLVGCLTNPDAASRAAFRKPLPELNNEWLARVKQAAELARRETAALTQEPWQAEVTLRDIITTDRTRRLARLYLAQFLMDSERYKEANEQFDELTRLVGLRGWALEHIGQMDVDRAYVAAQLGEFRKAREAVETASRIDAPAPAVVWATAALPKLVERAVPVAPPPRTIGRRR